MIRTGPLTPADLEDITRVHLQAFPGSDMSRLGADVVARYYRWQFDASHPLPFAEGAWTDDGLVGFVFGGVRREAVSGFVRRNAAAIVVAGVRHPNAARSLLGPQALKVFRLAFLRRRSRTPGLARGGSESVTPSAFGVLSVAVVPASQGSGVADQLMDAADAAALISGCATMNLTVHPTNVRAVRFYERRGWNRTMTGKGWSGLMAKTLSKV